MLVFQLEYKEPKSVEQLKELIEKPRLDLSNIVAAKVDKAQENAYRVMTKGVEAFDRIFD